MNPKPKKRTPARSDTGCNIVGRDNTIRVAQLNVNRSRRAHDLLWQMALKEDVNLLAITEPNKTVVGANSWITDDNKSVAIRATGRTKFHDHGKGNGFVWVKCAGCYIYSCYHSPNATIGEFDSFMQDLGRDLQGKSGPIVVTGDFNAKSKEWGAAKDDARGVRVAEWMAAHNLRTKNDGKATFSRRGQKSHIDLTMCNPEGKVIDWAVSEEENLSDHNNITFGIRLSIPRKRPCERPNAKWDTAIFGRAMEEITNTGLCATTPKNCSDIVKMALQEAETPSGPPTTLKNAYWWNEDTARAHREAKASRRKLGRLRGRAADSELIEEAEVSYKTARRTLRHTIQTSKHNKWKELLEEVEKDPWGQAYQIVMKATKGGNPGMRHDPDKLEAIVKELFPPGERHEAAKQESPSRPPPFTREELEEAAARIRNRKAAGPDGIPPEAVKLACKHSEEYMLEVYNDLLKAESFPKIWKAARLVLIPKPNKTPDQPGAYRPICLIDILGKLYERLVAKRLEEELNTKGAINERQCGFRRKRSTITAADKVKRGLQEHPGEFRALVTLDIQNAFNSAPWHQIIAALQRKEVSGYITNIVTEYLSDRTIESGRKTFRMTAGVPQGSVLGPTLWNVFFDSVLGLARPPGIELVAYADDTAVVGHDRNPDHLKAKMNHMIRRIDTWMAEHGLRLASEKTEAIICAGNRGYNPIYFRCGERRVTPADTIKYLGIKFDRDLTFTPHIKETVAKAARTIGATLGLMPNIGGPGSTTRKIIAAVGESVLLYGAPIWADGMRILRNRDLMIREQRKLAVRVVAAYTTVSTDALQVVAGMIPIDLLAAERSRIYYDGTDKREARREIMLQWQERWSNSTKGGWTRRLIPEVQRWMERKGGNVDHFITQLLTGHGCFNSYRHEKLRKIESSKCRYCEGVDTVEHTFFECPRWSTWREEARLETGHNFNTDNVIEVMMGRQRQWSIIAGLCKKILTIKLRDERAEETA